MGFDDFFEGNSRHRDNYRGHGYQEHSRYEYGSHDREHGREGLMQWQAVLDRIKASKKLKMVVIAAGVAVLLTTTILVIVLFPLIIQLVEYISRNGLQGILDGATGFIDKLWKGSGK
ncbi:MAG: hypothetical protein NT040_16040 [Bacteroidetes bacterium]|nr:hypothetical protein [Bacteroidota bacterium]